jgi:hypothetical protein
MILRLTGIGSQYLCGFVDSKGECLDARHAAALPAIELVTP